MTRINLEKFYHHLNEKSITVTSTLDDPVWEFNLSTNYEVGYLSRNHSSKAVDSDQRHLSTISHSITSLV